MSLPRVRMLLAAGMSSMLLASVAVAEPSGGTAPAGTESTASDVRPRFIAPAPSGTILFSSNRHAPVPSQGDTELPDYELFAVNPDGSGLTQITDSPGALVEPRWSPDGDSLAFVWSQDFTDSQVWTSSRDGTNLSMLRETEGVAALSWSPDGGQLAYTDNEFVRILDVASGSDRGLVEGSWPSWSIVGGSTVVVYTSGEFVGEGSDIGLRVIEPDGTNDRPILFGPSDSPSDLTIASEASGEPGTGRIAFVAPANGYQRRAVE
jgi:Tol biopolymer transport system component